MFASPKRSTLLSGLIHASAIALILLTTGAVKTPLTPDTVTPLVLPGDLTIDKITPAEKGGGGGQYDQAPPRRGILARIADRVFVPPTTHYENQNPVLTMEEAIFANVPAALPKVDLALIGTPNGARDSNSGGPGGPGGIGASCCGGMSDRRGDGGGDGDPSGVGGGRSGLRDATTQPTLLTKAEPEYTEEARKANLQGSVLLRIVVDERGRAQNIVVMQSLGPGLDERAVESVKRWTFRPGTRGGKAVPTAARVQVTFRLL